MNPTEPHAEPLLTVDKYSRIPIYEQIVEQVEMHVALGDLAPEDQLPSVRALSVELSVNPNTLQKAYTELERRGLCYTVPGSGVTTARYDEFYVDQEAMIPVILDLFYREIE